MAHQMFVCILRRENRLFKLLYDLFIHIFSLSLWWFLFLLVSHCISLALAFSFSFSLCMCLYVKVCVYSCLCVSRVLLLVLVAWQYLVIPVLKCNKIRKGNISCCSCVILNNSQNIWPFYNYVCHPKTDFIPKSFRKAFAVVIIFAAYLISHYPFPFPLSRPILISFAR